jgi:hypothetical protein
MTVTISKHCARDTRRGAVLKHIAMQASTLALLATLSACHDNGGATAAANASILDLRPAPDVSASQKYQAHLETAAAAADQPVARSKQYMLVLGSVANDNH